MKVTWDNKEWRRAKQRLSGLCPPPDDCDVIVRRVRMDDESFGDSEREEVKPEPGFEDEPTKYRYVIRVNSGLPTDFAIWVLIHEWAHVLVWPIYGERDTDHGAYWGVAYGKAYQAAYPSNQ